MAKWKSRKEQTTQWPKEKVELERIDNTMTKRKSRKEQTTQWPKEKVEKNRQHNGQKKKYKRTNNDLQNIHITLKIE